MVKIFNKLSATIVCHSCGIKILAYIVYPTIFNRMLNATIGTSWHINSRDFKSLTISGYHYMFTTTTIKAFIYADGRVGQGLSG